MPEDNMQKIYSCPMHSNIRLERPGICLECGMKLVEVEDGKTKYNKHAGHKTASFLQKFWVCLLLTIPVLFYSELIQDFFGFEAPVFPGSQYISLIFSSAIFFYGGWVFIVGMVREIRARMPGMMTLIGIAISAAYFWSIYVVFFGKLEDALFWELSTLIVIMLLGHWIEMKAVSGAQSALKELSKLLPDRAEVVVSTSENQIKTKTVPLEKLTIGDIVLVRPGGKIPADGVVISGSSEVNEAIVTGESAPVSKFSGSEVIAGTINGDGSLQVKVTKIGENTFLAGVMRLVAQAQASKSRLQLLSDRAAYFLTVIATSVGGIALLAWLWLADIPFAVSRMVAVLVIACPHALGLAVPLVASISTTLAAKNGFLVKQRLALELARKVNVVLFDKTGTLTKGEFGVSNVISVSDKSEVELLKYAASVDVLSEHPIAKAIVKEAEERKISLLEVTDFSRLPGRGVQAKAGEDLIYVGRKIEDWNFQLSPEFASQIKKTEDEGKTIIYVLKNKELLGVVALADIIRPESREAIKVLHNMGIKTAMITGDSEEVATWVAKELEIDEYFARVLPEEKAEKVKLLQAGGKKVAFVGDGVNDAPALMQADVGIAIGAGTNVALESAGIILVRNDPRDIPRIIRLSQLTYTKMIQNLFWATGYNVVTIPLAAGILAPLGIFLQPAVAAVLMSLSTVIVSVNAVFLRKAKI